MTKPNKLPEGQKDRENLGTFYDIHKNAQWFERAELVPSMTAGKLTLEVYVNYNPLLIMKELLAFAQRFNYEVKVVDLSHK
jgi:hypothetical protein